MEYQLTKKGKEKVISFIKYCGEEGRLIMLKRLYTWCKDNWLAIVSCAIIVIVATIAIAANIVIYMMP